MNELEKMMYEESPKESKIKTVKRTISLFYRHLIDKLKYTGAVMTGKILPYNKEYKGAPHVTQEVIEENPRRFIIEECVDACKILWSKNIYTFMCSDSIDKNAWIELELKSLSEENLIILEKIKKQYNCYQYHEGCINIPVEGMGASARENLIKMANLFKMQDVPDHLATISEEDLLITQGCFKEIENENYEEEYQKWLTDLSFASWGSPIPEQSYRVIDYTKMTKPLAEYIKDAKAIQDDGKIYLSRYHYNKHLAWNIHCHKENRNLHK